MIKDIDTLLYIFSLCKYVKKPLIKIFPDGRIIGTDEQFSSLNILDIEANYNVDIPYVFKLTELSSFMRALQTTNKKVVFSNYEILINKVASITNYINLSYQFDELYNRVMSLQNNYILYSQENFQDIVPDMFRLKVADGAKMYSFGVDTKFLMTSFNTIHPANKSDKVDLIIRDCDIYSYIAEFIINKKGYVLHEFLRFRKL